MVEQSVRSPEILLALSVETVSIKESKPRRPQELGLVVSVQPGRVAEPSSSVRADSQMLKLFSFQHPG